MKLVNIPQKWQLLEFGEIVNDMGDGGTPARAKSEYFNGDINWCTVKDITHSISETSERLSSLGLRNSSAKLWPENSIILSTGATIGHVGIAKIRTATKQGITGIVLNKNEVDVDYIYYLLNSLTNTLHRYSQGSTFKEIRPPLLSKIPVLVPPLPEQRKIAKILSTVDEAIKKTDAIIQETQQLKRGLMQKLFTEGIRHTRFKETKIGRIPEKWELVKLGEFCNFTTGKLNSNQATPDGVYPFFTCSQDTLLIDRYSFDCEALLLSGNNAVGKYSVKHYVGKFNAYQRTYVITIKDKESLQYIYLQSIFETKLEELRRNSIGTATQYLTLRLLLNLQIPKPPFSEQQSIAQILSEVDTKIESEQSYKQELDQLKKGLMQVLLTGQIRVKV